ncbi:hypothetical protein ACFQVA_38020 [Actinomadura keratinilytica]
MNRTATPAGPARPGFLWAVPAAVFFGLFAVVPLVMVAVLSFAEWDGLSGPRFAASTTGGRCSTTPSWSRASG